MPSLYIFAAIGFSAEFWNNFGTSVKGFGTDSFMCSALSKLLFALAISLFRCYTHFT